jgi:cell division protein ZapA
MSDTFAKVNVRILEKEYQVSCPISERAALLDAAELLNKKMREIRDAGKVIGLDRIAVMAALNITNDFLAAQSQGENISETVSMRLRNLTDRVETALQKDQQMDL